jgi:hypothetical protein
VFYWKDTKGGMQHSMHNMPVFIVHGDTHFYGLPQVDIPGVKSICPLSYYSPISNSFIFFLPVGWHHSGTEIDINTRNRKLVFFFLLYLLLILLLDKSTPAERERVVSKFVRETFPNLVADEPVHKVLCLYTTTPDEDFIIDYHPTYLPCLLFLFI